MNGDTYDESYRDRIAIDRANTPLHTIINTVHRTCYYILKI